VYQFSKGTLKIAQSLTDSSGEIIALHVYEAPQGSVQAFVDEEDAQKEGLSDYLLGSTAARVVRHAPCAMHVFRSA